IVLRLSGVRNGRVKPLPSNFPKFEGPDSKVRRFSRAGNGRVKLHPLNFAKFDGLVGNVIVGPAQRKRARETEPFKFCKIRSSRRYSRRWPDTKRGRVKQHLSISSKFELYLFPQSSVLGGMSSCERPGYLKQKTPPK
ncbi:MAG: hypothetical protein ACREDR_41160, partial [Blastocatellia bacterium]